MVDLKAVSLQKLIKQHIINNTVKTLFLRSAGLTLGANILLCSLGKMSGGQVAN